MKKFLLSFFDKSFSFSPKKPFQILAERRATRREAISSQNAEIVNWRDSRVKYPQLQGSIRLFNRLDGAQLEARGSGPKIYRAD